MDISTMLWPINRPAAANTQDYFLICGTESNKLNFYTRRAYKQENRAWNFIPTRIVHFNLNVHVSCTTYLCFARATLKNLVLPKLLKKTKKQSNKMFLLKNTLKLKLVRRRNFKINTFIRTSTINIFKTCRIRGHDFETFYPSIWTETQEITQIKMAC